ncbi:MAG: adenylosuccinate lyase, partial [Chloroflexota bacterium]
MIARYTLPEMAELWTDQARFEHMLRVEIAALGAVERNGLVPAGTTEVVAATARVDVERIAELEQITDHDVIAFVSQVAETTGPEGRFLHFGLTSSDVVDTALALQCQDAAEQIDEALVALIEAISRKAREHAATVMMGRTHSVHAEPITLGLKLASWAFEVERGRKRIAAAAQEISVGKLSGAVGTYSQLGPEIEAEVMAELGLGIEPAATQVVARDRHAAFVAAIAVCGGSIERAATEVRNLQHTEIGELAEPFRAGQKGSSAMPHKRNPITSERLAGLARLLRGYAGAVLEDEALWHERDIAHSSVERVALPGATTLIHYMAVRMTRIVEGLVVRPERMRENLDRGLGLYASSRLLTALVEQGGLSREDAYAIVQRAALKAADERRQLRELVESDTDVTGRLSGDQIGACFDLDQGGTLEAVKVAKPVFI